MTWNHDELSAIGEAEELEIAPRLADGTLIKPVTIWVVRYDDGLYVRSYKGENSHWFTVTQLGGEGRITAGGVTKDVTFVRVDDSQTNDDIDLAYRMKYRDQDTAYVDPMVAGPAKGTTLRLVPRQVTR
ncbi:DUF2255 family protein [Herbidospora mongoliensis]|uniref:DUF2255 family protein n=1 Tax=Herbidospora mongoliensis TaxID=688067 RepID=UPI00082F06DE|nr:DUF2255 family protein [Herbidospora mongoliensis]